jgi:hypothetical protein
MNNSTTDTTIITTTTTTKTIQMMVTFPTNIATQCTSRLRLTAGNTQLDGTVDALPPEDAWDTRPQSSGHQEKSNSIN